MTIVKRRKRDTDEMAIDIEISRCRRFSFQLPEIPFDNEDTERIATEFDAMDPCPDEYMLPVPDGYGGLVSDGFDLMFWEDKREDYEIMLDIEEAVRRGLVNRAFREEVSR